MLKFAVAATAAQPDYIALAMVAVLFVIVAVMALRKRFGTAKKADPVEATPEQPAEKASVPVAPGSAGHLKIHDVEPKTAAMLMAIVANKMGKPLNELRFISIKEDK